MPGREVVVKSIDATTTAPGFPVEDVLDTSECPAGIKIPDQQMHDLEGTGILERHPWHGEWNRRGHEPR